MFFNAHAFVASKIFGSDDPLLLLGSVLPDISITGLVPWREGLHGEYEKFNMLINEQYPELANISNGVWAHNLLDDYSHHPYDSNKEGYTYRDTLDLIAKVKEIYDVDDLKAKIKAHNYIETAVDIHLLKKYPKFNSSLVIKLKEVDVSPINGVLNQYFKIDEVKVEEAMSSYLGSLTKYGMNEQKNWLKFWTYLEDAMDLKHAEEKEKEELIEMALVITQGTYQEFLAYTIKEGTRKRGK